MLERIIEHINGHEGVRWATIDEIADDFIAAHRDGLRCRVARYGGNGRFPP